MIGIIQKKDDLLILKDEWNELYSKSKTVTPFQSFAFIISSITYLSNDENLHVICVRNGSTNELEAILPCSLDKDGTLRFINVAHVDFCGAIITPEVCIYGLCEEFAKYFLQESLIKKIVLDNLLHTDPMLSAFKPFVKTCFVNDCNYYSTIDIFKKDNDKDFVDSFRNVNAKQRKNFRTLLKTNAGNIDFHIYRIENGDDYPEEIVSYLCRNMIDKGIRVKEYFSDNMLNFWRDLYHKGILIPAVLKIDGEVKSLNFMYYDANRNEYIKWIMLYLENRFNLLINLYISKYLYENESATINFARGIYDYKMVNFHPEVKAIYRLIISKSVWSSLWALWQVNFYFIKQIAKKILRG